MEQRKHTKNRILRPNVRPRKHTFSLAQQIRMREHYALGIGGCARGIEKGSEVVRLSRHWRERCSLLGKNVVQIRKRSLSDGRSSLVLDLRGDSRPRLYLRLRLCR